MTDNERVFLRLIMWCEGTNKLEDKGVSPYSIVVGYSLPHISNFADHPRRRVKLSSSLVSSAAGAFQFLESTWDRIKVKLSLPDFNTNSQNLAAIQLIKERGAYDDVMTGQWESAITKCSYDWASFPPSRYGQPTKTLQQCLTYIESLKQKGFKPLEEQKKNFNPLILLLIGFLLYNYRKSIKNALFK